MLITTVDATLDASDVLRLYRARWHVELLFTRMKQQLHITHLRGRTPETLEATVRVLLVAWAFQEDQVAAVRAAVPDGTDDPQAPASSWLLAGRSIQTLRTQVRGCWTRARVWRAWRVSSAFWSAVRDNGTSRKRTSVTGWPSGCVPDNRCRTPHEGE